MQLNRAILFLVFNRPQTTKIVFEAIRNAKPVRLYINADGPRQNRQDDVDNIAAVKAIFDKIDWPCEVITNYNTENFGCLNAVSGGISWFFEHEKAGIILEDDCFPDASFFTFCDLMLTRYASNEKIMHIGGNSYQDSNPNKTNSYFYSRYNHIWGWATWRRAWNLYDPKLEKWPSQKENKLLTTILNYSKAEKYWTKKFDKTHAGEFVWDYRWTYSIWSNHGLAVLPWNNLVKNIGLDQQSTHAFAGGFLETYSIEPITNFEAPKKIEVDLLADKLGFDNVFTIPLSIKLKSKLKQLMS